MKTFLKISGYLILVLILLSFVLDKLYTYAHYNGAPRTKPDLIMSMKPKDSLDYVVLGSSRVFHNVDIDLIEKMTNKKGFNFGIPGSSVFEIKLSVQQLLKRKITKNIYIQIDYIWNEFEHGGECTVDWLTYINEPEIWAEFEEIDLNNEFLLYKNIPFLRYCKYGSKLGFRELFMSIVLKKKMGRYSTRGFESLTGNIKDPDKKYSYKLKEEYNVHIKEIIEMCHKENVNLFFFTSPIFNFDGTNAILEKNLPNYTDFSNSFMSPKYFLDPTHVNIEGSVAFTELFVESYLLD